MKAKNITLIIIRLIVALILLQTLYLKFSGHEESVALFTKLGVEPVERITTGIDFSIIELNGAGSEPTHIYDPMQTVTFARKEIVRHWHLLYKIAKYNMQNGVPAASFLHGVQLIFQHKNMIANLLILQQRLSKASTSKK